MIYQRESRQTADTPPCVLRAKDGVQTDKMRLNAIQWFKCKSHHAAEFLSYGSNAKISDVQSGSEKIAQSLLHRHFQSINQYSFNERHVKTQANTCMTCNWVNVTS